MKVDLVTVTYNTWATYTERLIRMVEYYTDPAQVEQWVLCDNASADAVPLFRHSCKLPVCKVFAPDNIGDLPRYNQLITADCTAEIVIAVSTDIRLLGSDWIATFLAPFADPQVGMVGCPGPGANMTPAHAEYAVGGSWHWIPKLLVDRQIPFTDCQHVQTHLFAIRRQAFEDVGGFWTADMPEIMDKGHLIAGEVSMGPRLKAKGWQLAFAAPAHYHYGSAAKSAAALDAYDQARGWSIPWN